MCTSRSRHVLTHPSGRRTTALLASNALAYDLGGRSKSVTQGTLGTNGCQ